MKNFIGKNKEILIVLFIIISIIICIVSIFLVINNSNNSETKIHEIYKDNYFIQYDDTWKSVKEANSEVKLIHKKSNSELNVKINELDNEIQYKTLDEIFDSLLYNIQEQNKNYNLIYKEKIKLTKNNMDGYKILFESNDRQASIYFYKQGSKVAVITYEALYDYFDILLDSVNNIVYNFNINEPKFNVLTSININTEEITYTEEQSVKNILKPEIQDEISNNNYLVNYSIPGNFIKNDYNSQYVRYEFNNLPNGASISLQTSILGKNMYEYLDKDEWLNIYDDNLNSYNKSSEKLNKFKEEPLSYIYKNNHLSDNKIAENITIAFELNKNHLFVVEISSNGVGIPKELIDMIKINSATNVASNIKIEKENGFLIGRLKKINYYNDNKTEEYILKLPENYKEIDTIFNLYKERHYGLEFNEKLQNYEYEVTYKLMDRSIESELNSLDEFTDKEYGEYKDFVQLEDITINNRQFEVYERGYTDKSEEKNENGEYYKYYVNEKVLFYQLPNYHDFDESYLAIIIKGNNDNKISNEQVKQLTNFDINII